MDRKAKILLVVVLCVWLGGALVIVFSENDHWTRCQPPAHASRFRSLSSGSEQPYSFYGIPSPACPSAHPFSCAQGPARGGSALLWAWLIFVGSDVSLREGALGCNRSVLVNEATPYIDGSQVYGTNASALYARRRNDGSGKMASQTSPWLDPSDSQFFGLPQGQHPLAWALETLFLREHNYWCERLRRDHREMGDTELFQHARHLVGAEIQVITYREALPVLVVDARLDAINCFAHRQDRGALALEAETDLLFAAWAAYAPRTLLTRHYHTGVPATVSADALTPDWFAHHGLSALLLGAARQFVGLAGSGYNATVLQAAVDAANALGLPGFREYHHRLLHRECAAAECACAADLPSGLLLERVVRGRLPPVAAELLKKQLARLKHNDWYFYAWDNRLEGYRAEIHNTRLASVILRNTAIDAHLLHSEVFEARM